MTRYRYLLTQHFLKSSKRLFKKYPSLKSDIFDCLIHFDKSFAIPLGEGSYKIRLKSSDLQRGKNKSFRLILLLIEMEALITPVCIYYKGDKEIIPWGEIKYHAKLALDGINAL